MKTNSIGLLCLTMLLAFNFESKAQVEPSMKSLETLSEKDRFCGQKLMQPHKPLIVNNYDLKYHRFYWFVDPAQDFIRGAVTSYFLPTDQQMTSIQFELTEGMSADSAYHRGFMYYSIAHTGDVITVPFGEIIPFGSLDSVTVYYHGNPGASGFGSFGREMHDNTPALWTLSEPFGAKDWWPSKNDLSDKIDSIDVFAVTPKGNHVASNGLLVSETPFGSNYTIAHWKHRYPIASYLIAIATTNYARYSDYFVQGGDSLQVLNYVYPEDSAVLRGITPGVLPSIGLFEELFTPYPFRNEKYGQAQFGWGGGMEHQTMTFLGRGAFNHELMAHELAHMWFGDMITCASWHDIWINEGFATFCAGLTYEHFFDGIYWQIWKNNNISYVCTSPGGSVYCDDTTSVNRIFDGRLSYSKGALLLQMLRWVVGDEDFFAGMKNYLNDPKLKHGFASTTDFKSHIEAASGRDLTEFFADWYFGQGFPTYTVQVGQSPDKTVNVIIHQEQSHPSVSFFEMPVPIRFYGNGKDTTLVFDHTYSGQAFSAVLNFTVDSVKFDPDLWLISANNFVSLGKSDIPSGAMLTLMPNPASDFLQIRHSLGVLNSIEILSVEGKKEACPVTQNQDSQAEVDIRGLYPGMYLLRIGFGEGLVTRKFLVGRGY